MPFFNARDWTSGKFKDCSEITNREEELLLLISGKKIKQKIKQSPFFPIRKIN